MFLKFCYLLVFLFGFTLQVISQKTPNVLYIFTDDQSARTLSCYSEMGSGFHTPNIDRLAAKGVKFRYAYTGAKCVPSRGSAITGRLQHNYTKESAYWPVTFRKQGYYTGMIGKWHWDKPRHEETWDWSAVWEHHLPENKTNYYWDQSLRINNDSLMDLKEYSTDAYTNLAVNFIKKGAQNKDKPWFLWLCYGGVHGPYTPADRHIGSYAAQPEIRYPKDVFGPRPDKPEHVMFLEMNKRDKVTGKPMWKKRTLDSWVKQYNEAVRAIDEGVGRLVEALEETGQYENTVIIFTSDNGYAWGHHGYNLKIAPYDANLLTPLIFTYGNKVASGKECPFPVNGVDIIATIHSLCNIRPDAALDGRDLAPLLSDPGKTEWRDQKMVQIYTGNNYGNEQIRYELERAAQSGDWSKFNVHNSTGTKAWMMLRDGKYKYVRHIYKNYCEELYNLDEDPEELVNLAVRDENRKLLRTMRQQLLIEFEKKGATFLKLLPAPLEKTVN